MLERGKMRHFILFLLKIGQTYIIGTRSLYQCISATYRLELQIEVF